MYFADSPDGRRLSELDDNTLPPAFLEKTKPLVCDTGSHDTVDEMRVVSSAVESTVGNKIRDLAVLNNTRNYFVF